MKNQATNIPLISNHLKKLARSLYTTKEQEERFINALVAPKPAGGALLWTRPRPPTLPFAVEAALPWQPSFVDRIAANEAPGRNPLHEQGYYYCLDLSSVFAASALCQIERALGSTLDMCAAPGGKAVFASQALKPELLLCNETIHKRTGALISNLKRCRIQPAAVVSCDPEYFGKHMQGCFDVVIVDAPCSGQSLIAKGEKSPGCFHPATINLNANRQKRILANACHTVAPKGFLAYMTCTYSRQENEAVVLWLMKRFKNFAPINVERLKLFQSHLADFPCYRLWPEQGQGAGSFVALLQNQEEGEARQVDLEGVKVLWQAG